MAELKRTGYAKRLWDAWKDYEKEHGTLSGVQLAALVEGRIKRPFDDVKLSKIHRGKRRATVDEHYALAAELGIDPNVLAGHDAHHRFPVEQDEAPPMTTTRRKRKGR